MCATIDDATDLRTYRARANEIEPHLRDDSVIIQANSKNQK